MKVKTFRAPRVVLATVAQGRTILRGIWALFWLRRLLALGIFVGALVVGALIWPHDRVLLAAVHFWDAGQEEVAQRVAWYLSTWGDYPTYNVPSRWRCGFTAW